MHNLIIACVEGNNTIIFLIELDIYLTKLYTKDSPNSTYACGHK